MNHVTAAMAGTVLYIRVQPGENVKAGQEVIVLESMKMEVPILAEAEGTVAEIKVEIGDFVNDGDVLLVID